MDFKPILNFPLKEKTFFWVVFTLVLCTRLHYADAPMERDEGEYAYAGWRILRGELPYLDFYNMKFPGVYYFYALIFKAFGTSIISVRIAVMLLNFASGFFLFSVAKKWLGEGGAWLAAGIFLLLSLSIRSQGFIANCEHFVVFFYLFGLWLLTEKRIFWAGICLGMACLMKQHAAILALFTGFLLLNECFYSKNVKKFGFQLLVLGCGFFIPLLGLLAFMVHKNILAQFTYFTYDYAKEYSKLIGISAKDLLNQILQISYDNIGFWLIFWVTFVKILKNKKPRITVVNTPNWQPEQGYVILVFWLISFASVCPGFYFRPHYFQYICPATAVLIAYGLSVLKIEGQIKNWKIDLSTSLKLAFLTTFIVQHGYFTYYSPAHVSLEAYHYERFAEVKEFSEQLEKISKPTDKIGGINNDPQILFYTKRQLATGFLYVYPLLEKQKYAAEMTEKFISETEANKPEWLFSFSIEPGNDENNVETQKRLLDWFDNYSKNYNLKAVSYCEKRYSMKMKWDETQIDTSKEVFFSLYKRKDYPLSK